MPPMLHVSSIAHQGKVVLVATAKNGALFYTVKQSGFEENARSRAADQDTGWEGWRPLPLPGDFLNEDGHQDVETEDQSVIARERKKYAVPEGSDALLLQSRYHSQKLTAPEPVQLVSGLAHLFVFRQSTSKTLLVDRFVLDGMTNKLVRKLEVRFKRSRERYEPLRDQSGANGSTLKTIDSLDFKDENKRPFFEPTQEISHIGTLENGLFSVVLVPTDDHDVSRWHIFVWNADLKKVESFSIRATEEQVFDISDQFVVYPAPARISGIIRHSFDLNPTDGDFDVISTPTGLAASVYDVQAERETTAGPQLMREQRRIMLAVGTPKGMITLGFALASDGTMSRINTEAEGMADPLRYDRRDVILPVTTLDDVTPVGDLDPPAHGAIAAIERGDMDRIVVTSDVTIAPEKFRAGDMLRIKDNTSVDGMYDDANVQEPDSFALPMSKRPLGTWTQIKATQTGQFSDGMILGLGQRDGAMVVNAQGHGLNTGNPVQIQGTDSLDGLHQIESIEGDKITLRRKWQAGDAINIKAQNANRRGLQFNGPKAHMVTSDLGLDDPAKHDAAGITLAAWVQIPADAAVARTLFQQADQSLELVLEEGFVVANIRLRDGVVSIKDPTPAPIDEWAHYAVIVANTCGYKKPVQTTLTLIRDGEEVAHTGDLQGPALPIEQTPERGGEEDVGLYVGEQTDLEYWCAKYANAIAISGEWAIVGVKSAGPKVETNFNRRRRKSYHKGMVLFFRRSGDTWALHQKVDLPGLAEGKGLSWEGGFGHSVAIDGNTAVVGSEVMGPVRFYEFNGDTWELDLNYFNERNSDNCVEGFGYSVAIHDDTVLVGSRLENLHLRGRTGGPGVVYILKRERSGSSGPKAQKWRRMTKFTPKRLEYASSVGVGACFGHAVAMSANMVMVSAVNAYGGGQVFIYSFDSGAKETGETAFKGGSRIGLKEIQTLSRSSSRSRDYFGAALAIQGDAALISTIAEDRTGNIQVGTVANGKWEFVQTLYSTKRQERSDFGRYMAIHDDFLVAGAPGSSKALSVKPSIETFGFIGGTWRRLQTLRSDPKIDGYEIGEIDFMGLATKTTLFAAPKSLRNTAVKGEKGEPLRRPRDTSFSVAGSGNLSDPQAGTLKMAEVQIWNTARTVQDIKSSMFLVMNSVDPDLAGYWRLGGVLPGDPATVVDFSHSGRDATIHGDAFVADRSLDRHLKSEVNGKPAPAISYVNNDLVAVTENANYVERFEFKLDKGMPPPEDLFKFQYWGKRSHAAVKTTPIEKTDAPQAAIDFAVSQEKFTRVKNTDWWIAKCNFRIPKDVNLLRSFGICAVSDDESWSKMHVRNHSVSCISNSITEAHYQDTVPLAKHADDTEAVAALVDLDKEEKSAGYLWRERQIIQMQLHNPDGFAKEIADLEVKITNKANDIKDDKEPRAKHANDLMALTKKRVTLYYNDNFGPDSPNKKYHAYIGKLDFHTTGWNNITTSVRVPAGLTVTLYDGVNQTGEHAKITTDDPNVGHSHNFNDKTSSLWVKTAKDEEGKVYGSKAAVKLAFDAAHTNLNLAWSDLKELQDQLKDKQSKSKLGRDTLEARLIEIDEELSDLAAKMAMLNKTVTDGIIKVWGTPQVMEQIHDDRGLVTNSAILVSARPKGRITALDTCQGNVQFSFVDTDNRTRHVQYDPVSDSENAISEAWLPEGLRACLDVTSSSGKVRLAKPVELHSEWTFEAWVLFPLIGQSNMDWSPDPYISCLAGTSDGAQGVIAARYDPNTDAEMLGSVFKSAKGAPNFVSSGFEVSRLKAGWHHVAVAADHNQMKFYIDGRPVSAPAEDQVQVIATPKELGRLQIEVIGKLMPYRSFGKFAEVRAWNHMLPDHEVAANAAAVLSGHEPGLVMYLPLNEAQGTTTIDVTGNGHDGFVNGAVWAGCSAPIGKRPDGDTSICCYEYSHISRSGAKKVAMMRRGFVSPSDGQIDIAPDRPIEELELVWVGNCQFSPTLLGYIEGAPPLPSENLTEKSDYSGATSVTLTNTSDVSYSWDRSEHAGAGGKAEFFVGASTTESTGEGIGVTLVTKFAEDKQGITGEIATGYAEVAKSHIGSSARLTESNSLSLRGTQERQAKFENLGKRFVPKNVGYALVISGLADVFITRMRRSGRMVAYQIEPVKDVPPDVNTITFLLNPAYTMAGSLDGMTGTRATSDRFFKHVPDMRAQFGSKYPASFMRLDEAYDLKSQIDRQDKQRAAYFENYQSHTVDAASLSREANAGAKIGDVKVTRDVEKKPETADQTADEKQAEVQAHIAKLKGDAAANVDKTSAEAKEREAEIKKQIAARKDRDNASTGFAYWQKNMEAIQARSGKRNLVNNYVWDADGGMHVESQSFANSTQHTIGGAFSMKGGLGGSGDFFFSGLGTSLEGQATFKLEQTMTKTEKHTDGFGLSVSLSGVESTGITDHDDYPLHPGEKVDRYRFMSFYLDGCTKNFNDFFDYVVDPEWLASNDEEARALRQAQGKANKTWRVLHRVTYVERPALMGFGQDG
ncbi:LamG-like jellyroll fold domain-containing protein [Shimia sp. NS0008-38b]|uniref:LamG-like jellyroll fold domain-containing protein n=1 Tax=Shimia sp. NS0008-38b TaxID=3127653 RepID=UPI00334014EC